MYNKHLETFICVADFGSFSKTAEKLYISSTAIIKQINLLEQELGLQLFERNHKGIELTKAGKSIYGDAKYLIQYSKDSVTRAKNAMQSEEKTIRIGNSFMTPAQYIIKLWPKIKSYCSDIKFKIINFENTPERASEILLNLGDKIDIVPGWFDEKFWQLSECTAKKLEDEPLYCAMSINHPLAFRESISLNDLSGETVHLIKRGWNKHTDAFRDELWSNYPEINIVDVPFFNIDVFNQCEANNEILIGFNKWAAVHPLLKFVPLEQKRFVPFGILHASNPSPVVAEFLAATDKIL